MQPNGEPTQEYSNMSAAAEGRERFKKELKPTIGITRQAQDLHRTLDVYRTSLSTAVDDKDLSQELKDAAFFVMRHGERFGGRDREGVDVAPGPKSHLPEDTLLGVDELGIKGVSMALEKNTRELYDWYAKRFGGTAGLLLSKVHATGEEDLTEEMMKHEIGRNLANWISIKSGMGILRDDLEQKQMGEMIDLLLEKAPSYHGLRSQLGDASNKEQSLDDLLTKNETNIALQRIDPAVRAFEMKDWLATTAKEARAGKRIYETPYYTDLIDKIAFLRVKKNGVGGVILNGPPGTGKTEVIQEANKKDGYKTRVVSIHHYSSYEDLIAGKAIQLGIDQGASSVQKINGVISAFEGDSGADFGEYMTSLFHTLQQEGKLTEVDTLGGFLNSFTSNDVRDRLSKPTLDADDWDAIKQSFVTAQKAKMARSLLPAHLQESTDEIVRGEILEAMQNGERVILDELDKAGPNSMGGLLGLLSLSSGQEFTFGNTTVTIPPWFTIDATSNKARFGTEDQWLLDRFSQQKMDIPPTKDQLMIAAVKLSDRRGNILLTPQEQAQVAGFFTYAVPALNEIFEKANPPFNPLSNRSISEFTSYLVDGRNDRRTAKSVRDAVDMLLLENKAWAQDPAVRGQIEQLLQRFDGMISETPLRISKDRNGGVPVQRGSLRQVREQAMDITLSSPLITAIDGLVEPENASRKPHQVELSNQEVDLVQSQLTRNLPKDVGNNPDQRADVITLPTGLRITEDEVDKKLKLVDLPESGDLQMKIFAQEGVSQLGSIYGASADGKLMALASPGQNDDQASLSMVRVFDKTPRDNSPQKSIPITVGAAVRVDPAGKYVYILEAGKKNDNETVQSEREFKIYKVSDTGELQLVKQLSQTLGFELAQDGAHIIVRNSNGSMVLDTNKFQERVHLDAIGHFANNNLIMEEQAGRMKSTAILLR